MVITRYSATNIRLIYAAVFVISVLYFLRNSIVQLRTLETLIEITNESPMAINDFKALGMLDALKSGLDSSDVLTRFNIIELLAKVERKKRGCGSNLKVTY